MCEELWSIIYSGGTAAASGKRTNWPSRSPLLTTQGGFAPPYLLKKYKCSVDGKKAHDVINHALGTGNISDSRSGPLGVQHTTAFGACFGSTILYGPPWRRKNSKVRFYRMLIHKTVLLTFSVPSGNSHHWGRKCKDRLVFTLMSESSLYFRPARYLIKDRLHIPGVQYVFL